MRECRRPWWCHHALPVLNIGLFWFVIRASIPPSFVHHGDIGDAHSSERATAPAPVTTHWLTHQLIGRLPVVVVRCRLVCGAVVHSSLRQRRAVSEASEMPALPA
jgi:hypothetical protein